MSGRPDGEKVQCPECKEMALAVIPKTASVVEDEEKADGKVRVNCHECENQFLAFYIE